MKKYSLLQRAMGLFLSLALLISYAPMIAHAATIPVDSIVADPGTANSWEHMMGTDTDGNRYAGRVWADKSVYKDGDTVILNSRGQSGSSYTVSLEDDEAFQVVFSVLGSSMTTTESITTSAPMDVVLVLDDSTSMDDTVSGNTTRLEKLIDATNKLLADLSSLNDVRIGIVGYNQNSMQILPFGTYNNGIVLKVRNNKYTFDERNSNDKGGTIQAFDSDNRLLYNNTKGYNRGTNVQAGISMGLGMLEKATNTQGRTPVAIVLTDGSANTAALNRFYNVDSQTPTSVFSGGVPAGVAVATLLTASYKKVSVEKVYGKAPMVYGIGVDIAGDAGANAIINPGANVDGFNSRNTDSNIRTAYNLYTQWAAGRTVERTENYMGNYKFTFDHNYTGVTLKELTDNINYVDSYYPVASADLQGAFDQIYEELSSSVFNPISTSTSLTGGTGVDDTPLIYVDFIGQHMELKEITNITLFGASYGVINNGDGTYTVDSATGTNPTTNERWNTAQDIRISVTEQPDGTQKLEVRINQEILPIILEQVEAETVGNVTTATITELKQNPLRVFYTVGIDSDILLPNGKVDVSKIQNYQYIDDANGTVSFYSNRFGVENAAGSDNVVYKGDAHIGFRPSPQNRYYYHQKSQGIFTGIKDSNGRPVTIADNNEYGIVWDEDAYTLDWMTYAQYKTMQDNSRVYTYVTYYHPTPSGSDAANAAEEVTYLVYTDWRYLKESVAFYDDNTETYLGGGKVIPQAQVESYIQQNPNARIYAVLGVGSRRTSRLHNMMVGKVSNPTGTAVESYTPEYLEEKAAHNDNDVIIWLGNNGKLTVDIDTGIALTKAVTEAIGNPNDTYALTVTVPAGVTANPVVVDENGNTVESTYRNRVLTVNVKAGQTVYVSGIPGGTVCTIGENVSGDYYIASKTDTVTVPLVSQALSGGVQFAPAVVTNAPNKYGNLYITKALTSNHAIPGSILQTSFDITVHVGTALAGKTFSVEDSDHAQPYDMTVAANGNLYFQIKTRQTIEILGLPQGTAVTVAEENPGSHFQVGYTTLNHSGETADTDNTVVIPGTGSATAIITNRYTPDPVSVELDIVGTKNFIAEGSHAGGSFTYKVQKWTGSKWEDIPGKTAETAYAAGETGVKNFTITDVLSGIPYTEIGSHAYQVVEVKGDAPNVTYDRTLYTFTVTVTDNGGQLVAAVTDLHNTPITDGAYEVSFVNTYHTAPISIDVQKLVENPSGADGISLAGFEFSAVQTDDSWIALPGAIPYSVHTDAAGEARFTSVCTQAGTYRFLLTEVNRSGYGWTYSGAEYRVTVAVTEDNGNLTATLSIEKVNSDNEKETATVNATDATRGTVTFVNTYAPASTAVDLDGAVSKVLTGKTLEAGDFTFYVYADGDRTTPILTGINGLNGDVSLVDFDKVLTFNTVGSHPYDIVEAIPAEAVYDPITEKYILDGMYYDPTIYDLMVEVTNDAATGALVADYYFEDAVDNAVTFHNEYRTTPTEYTLSGTKLLHGRAPRNEEFTFQLYEGENLLQTAYNKADGSFTFQPIPYTAAGTYTYTIRELAGNVPGVTYMGVDVPVIVTVTVTDTDGVLTATADIENKDIRFVNYYTPASAQIGFNGTKIFKGGDLTVNGFIFNLYATDHTFATDGLQPLASVSNINSDFAFERMLTVPGTYYYVIEEDASAPVEDIVYDRTRHTFLVQVSDDGNGQLKAAITNTVTGETTQSAASVTADVTFTNATFEEVTKKEVFIGEDTVNIDGQKVEAGDVLTYRITYTNYTGASVVAQIADIIPAHTTYVEGSASHNGSYAGNHVAWVLNVEKGETVTVSFQVMVEETETEAIISNIAAVRDGVNTYTTNEVLNPIQPTEPTEPPTEPTEPPTEPTEPPTEPTEPPTEPTEPPTEPTEPPTEPTEPPTEPTEPPTEPVEPPTEPVEPPVDPPADPSNPQTGDHMQLHLWFAALFVSCGGMIVTMVLGKKRKAV